MNQGSLEIRLIPGLQLGNYKMVLKHFVALESKEVIKEYWVYIKKKQ